MGERNKNINELILIQNSSLRSEPTKTNIVKRLQNKKRFQKLVFEIEDDFYDILNCRFKVRSVAHTIMRVWDSI